MTKELYDELREIEDRLYNIATEIGEIYNSKVGSVWYNSELGDAWSLLYTYLEKNKQYIDL